MSDTTILLDIYEKLGSVEAKLNTLAEKHKDMEAEVAELKEFKTRIGAYIWLGGSIVAGVIMLLWQGLQYFSDEVRGAIGRLFH